MFTREEIQALADGLDSLARNSKDVIVVSMRLAPIRVKLEELLRELSGNPKQNEGDE
jgi:hypothetical protein